MKKRLLGKKVAFYVIGSVIGLESVISITGCDSKNEQIETTIETTTVYMSTEDLLNKLTTQEALVDTVAEDIKDDTKEINGITATAHVVKEYFTDGIYVEHKTYKAGNVDESETEVIIYKPKDSNIIRLADGLHKIVEKTEDCDCKYSTDKVIVDKNVIPENEVEYEKIVIKKDIYDKAVKDNAKRENTFVEGNKDPETKQETAVKNKTEEISKTIKETPKETQATQEETTTSENKETETSKANNNTSSNNAVNNNTNNNSTNTNNNSTNKNNNSSANNNSSNKNNNNNSSNKQNNTPKQTEAPKQTQHTHTWKDRTTTYDEPIEGEEMYDTCSHEVVKRFDHMTTYYERKETTMNWINADSSHCTLGIRKVYVGYKTKTKTVGRECTSCGAYEAY